MIAKIEHKGQHYTIDLLKPIDISLEIEPNINNPSAWYVEPPIIEPVKGDNFIGAVEQGGSVNFRNIFFNPHGHGTHTECLGHITEKVHNLNTHLTTFFFIAELVSIQPKKMGVDQVITKKQIEDVLDANTNPEALIIRTLPNDLSKKSRQYSNTNPPYLSEDAAKELANRKIKHLLIDTPSVDKEQDEGKLLAHHAFWDVPTNPRFDCTITELIYVPQAVTDGTYLLNIGFASFNNDASPSKPVIYKPV